MTICNLQGGLAFVAERYVHLWRGMIGATFSAAIGSKCAMPVLVVERILNHHKDTVADVHILAPEKGESPGPDYFMTKVKRIGAAINVLEGMPYAVFVASEAWSVVLGPDGRVDRRRAESYDNRMELLCIHGLNLLMQEHFAAFTIVRDSEATITALEPFKTFGSASFEGRDLLHAFYKAFREANAHLVGPAPTRH